MSNSHRVRINTYSPPWWGFFIYRVYLGIILGSILAQSASAVEDTGQWIRGSVQDSLRNPVSYVSIYSQYSGTWVFSDGDGDFEIYSSNPLLDTLHIQRIGYIETHVSLNTHTQPLLVTLASQAVILPGVAVEASQQGITNLRALQVAMRDPMAGELDKRLFFSSIAGLSLKSYGGPAGISTLSMDGGPSAHTKILVAGFDITNAQNGETDISQLPLPFIESVSYHPFEIGSSSSGNVDGLLHLNPGLSGRSITLSVGSYGHDSQNITWSSILRDWYLGFGLGHRQDDGDYPAHWQEEVIIRRNNHFSQDYGHAHLRRILSERLYLELMTLASRQDRGVAGQIWSPDTLSRRKDQLALLGSKLVWLSMRGGGHLQLFIRDSRDHFVDPVHAIDARHNMHTWHLSLDHQTMRSPSVSIEMQVGIRQEVVESDDLDENTRTTLDGDVSITWKLTPWLQLTPGSSHETVPGLYQETLWDVSIISPLSWGSLVSIALHTGKQFRYPSFNDLYWEPGGNPDLEPEYSQDITIQSRFQSQNMGQLVIQAQYRETDNLIQWMPQQQAYWRPENLSRSRRRSVKFIWQNHWSPIQLDAYAHYSYHSSTNLNPGYTHGKSLRYAPRSTAAMNLKWRPMPLSVNLDAQYVGERISYYNYPEDVVLPATLLLSTSIGYLLDLNDRELTTTISVDNLLDTRYESIKGYPEPGRQYRLTLNMQF